MSVEVTDVLGPPKDRAAVERPVLATLEAPVPPDNFYRHLERHLDLGFVRELVRDRYARFAPPSRVSRTCLQAATRSSTIRRYR